MYKVFLLEDEVNFSEILKRYLEMDGYEVKLFRNGLEAIKAVREDPHVWILDIMLPDITGYEVFKKIKEHNQNVPVIFMSARDSDVDRLLGLELGSDDYISKPFLPKELLIRLSKVINSNFQDTKKSDKIEYKGYYIDINRRIINFGEERIHLTAKEFDILTLFANSIGRAFSREEIMEKIWGDYSFGLDRSVDDLVRRLRKKMNRLDIETIYGYGYRLN